MRSKAYENFTWMIDFDAIYLRELGILHLG